MLVLHIFVRFLKLFADKYKFLLYKDKEYALARVGLTHAIAQRNTALFRAQLLLGLKLSIPNFMIDKMRQYKRRKA